MALNHWNVTEELERFYKNLKLFQAKFPEFWNEACKTKNDFYQKLWDEAEEFVNLDDHYRNEYGEYLKDNRFYKLWHQHCAFCMETITTETPVCYFTDLSCNYTEEDWQESFDYIKKSGVKTRADDFEKTRTEWICAGCFNEYADYFGWTIAKKTSPLFKFSRVGQVLTKKNISKN